MRKSVLLEYAHQPMQKELPRWTQSASTWRHTSYRYSFSKDRRFKDEQLNYSDILEPTLPSTNNNKSCSFGKGIRKPISEVVLRNAKEKPAPCAYDMNTHDESPRSARYGKTFGIGWSNFERVHIPHRKDVYSGHLTEDNPPAHYEGTIPYLIHSPLDPRKTQTSILYLRSSKNVHSTNGLGNPWKSRSTSYYQRSASTEYGRPS